MTKEEVTTIKAEVCKVTRVGASSMGNPTYSLLLREHSNGLFKDTREYRTAPNAGWAYSITDRWVGKFGAFTIKNNRILNADVEQ